METGSKEIEIFSKVDLLAKFHYFRGISKTQAYFRQLKEKEIKSKLGMIKDVIIQYLELKQLQFKLYKELLMTYKIAHEARYIDQNDRKTILALTTLQSFIIWFNFISHRPKSNPVILVMVSGIFLGMKIILALGYSYLLSFFFMIDFWHLIVFIALE